MKGFFQLLSAREFVGLFERFNAIEDEQAALGDCLGRILTGDIIAPEALPPFSRSTMDGFAVRARDTFGCSESEPALLTIIGEIAMGRPGGEFALKSGQAAAIWTGGELPEKSDAVVMAEYTNRLESNDMVEVFRPVAPGENIIKKGEDFAPGGVVLKKGRQLRPQDLGILAGVGITKANVFRRPVVAIISTGNELTAPDQPLEPGEIRDINSTTLAALVRECGCIPLTMGIIRDDPGAIRKACLKALEQKADVLLISGGSSVGQRDFTLRVFEEIDGTELLAHGVSIKPGKPTILAQKGNAALFGLPGHVGSAIVVFHILVRPLLRKLAGLECATGLRSITAVTTEQVPSTIGREDYVRVAIHWDENRSMHLAAPIYGKSGLLNTLSRADGLLIIGRDVEGLDKGEQAQVLLF